MGRPISASDSQAVIVRRLSPPDLTAPAPLLLLLLLLTAMSEATDMDSFS